MEISRELSPEENILLLEKCGEIEKKELSDLKQNLSYIHTGEMVPYYIQRYGFYEGFTSYRTDPVAISFIFGLRSLEELCETCLPLMTRGKPAIHTEDTRPTPYIHQ